MDIRTVHVKSSRQVRAVISQVVRELIQCTEPWAYRVVEDAAEALADQVKRDFIAKAYIRRGSDGIVWKESGAAKKRKGLTLIDTGQLLDSIQGRVLLTARAIISVQANADGRAPYAKFVFFGTHDAEGNQILPPRLPWPADNYFPASYRRVIAPIIFEGIMQRVAFILSRPQVAA